MKIAFSKHTRINILLSLVVTLFTTIVGLQLCLYGDSVLFIGKIGNLLYEQGWWNWGCLPTINDPGHPLLTASLAACAWTYFGKSLLVTRLVLVPFVFLFCYQLIQICRFLFHDNRWSYLAFALVLADPAILATITYLSPDILVLAFSSWALHAILRQNKVCKSLALAFLGITSLRGMLLCGGLFLLDFILAISNKQLKSWIQSNWLPYILGAMPACIFLIWRLTVKGWIIDNPLHPWGEATTFSSTMDFVFNFGFNIAVLGQRMTDFGRVIPILIILIGVFRHFILLRDKVFQLPLFIAIVPSLPIVVVSLIIQNPMGHSYFVWIYIGIALMLVTLISILQWSPAFLYGSICCLLMGHLIVYPDGYAQGWNASYASLPYWSLRQQMMQFIEDEHIPSAQTYWCWPESDKADDVDLLGGETIRAQQMDDATYVIYSNVGNLPDATLENLTQEYTEIKRMTRNRVYICCMIHHEK